MNGENGNGAFLTIQRPATQRMIILGIAGSLRPASYNRALLSAVRELKAAIGAADGVLFATPEYNNSIPGVRVNGAPSRLTHGRLTDEPSGGFPPRLRGFRAPAGRRKRNFGGGLIEPGEADKLIACRALRLGETVD